MRPEKRFWQRLFQQLGGTHSQRMELLTGAGVPDVSVAYKGRELWLELKVDKPLLRPAQLAWISLRSRHGGAVYVLVLRSRADTGKSTDDIDVYWWPFSYTVKGKYVEITSAPNATVAFPQCNAEVLFLYHPVVPRATISTPEAHDLRGSRVQ